MINNIYIKATKYFIDKIKIVLTDKIPIGILYYGNSQSDRNLNHVTLI